MSFSPSLKSLSRTQVNYHDIRMSREQEEEDPIENSDGENEFPSAQRPHPESAQISEKEDESEVESIDSSSESVKENTQVVVIKPPVQSLKSMTPKKIETHHESEIDDSIDSDSISQSLRSEKDEEIEQVSEVSQKNEEVISEEIEEIHSFLTSQYEEIDTQGIDEFFKEEFIGLEFIEDLTDTLDIWDCDLTRVLLCHYIPIEGESKHDNFQQIIMSGDILCITSSKSIKKELDINSRFLLKEPFKAFKYHDRYAVISPILVLI